MSNLCQSTPARPQSGRAANEPNRPKVPGKMLRLRLSDLVLVLALRFFSHIVRILLIWRHRVRNSQTTPDPDHVAAPSAIIQQLFHCLEKGFLFLFPLALLHFCATFALLIKFDIQVPCVCVCLGVEGGDWEEEEEEEGKPLSAKGNLGLKLLLFSHSLISKNMHSSWKESATKTSPACLGSYQ